VSLTISPARIVAESGSPLLAAPDTWPRKRLGDVATILNGHGFKSSQFVAEGGTPLIRIRDIRKTSTAVGFVGDYDDRYIVRSGDLLVGMDGDFNAARWAGPEALLNQRVCKITPDPEFLNLDYLTAILPGYLQAIHEFTSSTTVTHLSSRDVAEIPLPVPSLADQQAFASLTRTASASALSATAHLTRARRGFDRFRQAVLAAACTGRLTADWRDTNESDPAERALQLRRDHEISRLGKRYREPFAPDSDALPEIPENWAWATLPELGELGRGKSRHRPRNDPSLYGGEYPFIQTGDVARSGGLITSHTQTYNEAGLAQSRLWPARAVCITIAANIADSGLLTYPACFPDSVVGLISDEDVALPEYVELFIRTASADLAAFAPATAQANINLAILSEVAVAVPPIPEQREIVSRVTGLYRAADGLMGRVDAAGLRIDRTTQALLSKALRGELLVIGETPA
jgi:type I restriction enzyme S subunit